MWQATWSAESGHGVSGLGYLWDRKAPLTNHRIRWCG